MTTTETRPAGEPAPDVARSPATRHARRRAFDRRQLWNQAPSIVHYASLGAAFVLVMYLDRGQWFWQDEWEFITNRGITGGNLGIFSPHNEHWVTLPILVWRITESLVGLRHYWPYMATVVVLHIAIAHLLWRLMLRTHVDAWIATLLVLPFLVLGGGSESLIWAFQSTFLAPLAFGLAGLLILDGPTAPSSPRLAAYWILAVAGVMSSAVGITMVIVAGIALFLRHGWRPAALAVSVPAVAYGIWYAAIGHEGNTLTPQHKSQYLDVADYAWTGLRNVAEASTGLTGAGAVLLGALLVGLYVERSRAGDDRSAVYALALGAVAFFVMTGIGRISMGVDESLSSRYVYVGAVFLIPAAGCALNVVARSRVSQVALVIALPFAAVHGVDLLHRSARDVSFTKQHGRSTVTAAARIISSGAPVVAAPDAQVDPAIGPDLTVRKLRTLVDRGEITLAGVDATPVDVLAAEVALQTAIAPSDASVQLTDRAHLVALMGASTTAQQGDCVDIDSSGPGSRIRLAFDSPGSVRVAPSSAGVISVFLATDAAPTLFSPQRDTPVAAGEMVDLTVAVGGWQPLIALPAGLNQVCGLAS